MERVRLLAIAGTIGLAALLMSPAGPRAWGADGKLILKEDTHWKVWAVRGAMRIDGNLLKDKAECKKWGVTPGDVKSIGRERADVRGHFQTRLPARHTEDGFAIDGQRNTLSIRCQPTGLRARPSSRNGTRNCFQPVQWARSTRRA